MNQHSADHTLRLVLTLTVSVAATLSAGCASLPLTAGAGADQLTAALAEFHEGVRGDLVLDPKRLARFHLAEEAGQAPEVSRDGRHSGTWLDEVLDKRLADRLCTADNDCEASQAVTVVSLSRPFAGRDGVFVDAQLKSVTDTGYGLLRSTRLIRLQITEDTSGWRVVASAPIWENTG